MRRTSRHLLKGGAAEVHLTAGVRRFTPGVRSCGGRSHGSWSGLGHLLGGRRPVAEQRRPGAELGRLERAADRFGPGRRARNDHPGLEQHCDQRRRQRQRRRHLPGRHDRDQRRRQLRLLPGPPGLLLPKRQRLAHGCPQRRGRRHHDHRLRLLPGRWQQQLTHRLQNQERRRPGLMSRPSVLQGEMKYLKSKKLMVPWGTSYLPS